MQLLFEVFPKLRDFEKKTLMISDPWLLRVSIIENTLSTGTGIIICICYNIVVKYFIQNIPSTINNLSKTVNWFQYSELVENASCHTSAVGIHPIPETFHFIFISEVFLFRYFIYLFFTSDQKDRWLRCQHESSSQFTLHVQYIVYNKNIDIVQYTIQYILQNVIYTIYILHNIYNIVQ